MTEPLYRPEAVRELRSPEQLDSLLQLTRPASWIALSVLAFVAASAIVWGFVGSVPLQISGLGVLLPTDTRVYRVQAPAAGLIQSTHAEVNQPVAKGQRLAVISNPADQAALDDAQRELALLRGQYRIQQAFVERDIGRRQDNLEQQNATLQKKIADAQQYLTYLQDLLADQLEEQKLGYMTRQQTENTRTGIFSTQQSIAESQDALAGNQLTFQEYRNSRKTDLDGLLNQLEQAEGKVLELKARLDSEREVLSPVAGVVTEFDVQPGVLVAAGALVALIEERSEGLEMAAFFALGKGKQLQPGMTARVAVASVEVDLYGSIVGRVKDISVFPETQSSLLDLLGNATLVDQMMQEGAPIRALIALEEDTATASGLRWTSSRGPQRSITSGEQASATVTVAEQRPIDLVIPLFDTWLR